MSINVKANTNVLKYYSNSYAIKIEIKHANEKTPKPVLQLHISKKLLKR